VLTARFLREVLNGTAFAVPLRKMLLAPLISTVKAAAFGDVSEGARDFDFLPLFAVLTARFLREVLNGTAEAVPLRKMLLALLSPCPSERC
jgi:hypothetical protein